MPPAPYSRRGLAPTFFDNITYLRESVAPSKICVVLKANAYGHGLTPLVPVAVAAGADYLGICTNPEAAAVRALGFDLPIFRLRMGLPDELDQSAGELDIEEQVGTLEAAEYLSALGRNRNREMPVHIKIDAGMGRSGFFVEEESLIRRVCGLPGLKVVGILSHFASSDAADLRRTFDSLDAFERLCDRLADVLPDDVLIHTHNSAATVRLPERRHDMVRVGRGLLWRAHVAGIREPAAVAAGDVGADAHGPGARSAGGPHDRLRRAVHDAAHSRIAALPVGFGEGYPRALFNKGVVLIHGCRCPVVGRVSLNVVTVDVTDLDAPVRWGDEAVLVGRQGDEEISFEFLADKFSSVHTEINLMAGSMNEVEYE